MSKVEMAVWCALLVAVLVIGCREERRLILQEEELMQRLEEPWRFGGPEAELWPEDEP